MIHVLAVREYLRLISEGGLKEELSTNAFTHYIRVINNRSVERFTRQLGTCGDYFVKHKQSLFSKQGVHKKIAFYIGDEDIRSAILACLQIQKPPQQTDHKLIQFVITELLPDQEINTAISWINKLSFNVADTDKKKGLMYVDGHEIPNVVANINRLCG